MEVLELDYALGEICHAEFTDKPTTPRRTRRLTDWITGSWTEFLISSGMSNITSSAPNAASSASWLSPGAGITAGYDGSSDALRTVIIALTTLALYNACELVGLVSLTFSKHHGLYYWSLLISSIGIIPYSLGFMLKFLNLTPGNLRWIAVTFLTVGWYPMITGQALVLWSRLHLILSGVRGERILNWTKWMIIINAVCLHIPTTVLTYGANSDTDTSTFEGGYNIMEKIQMAGFFIQEVVLSSIYIVETVKILRTSLQPHTRRTMIQLVAINVTIILMDLGLLGIEAASLYILETLVKGVIYSIKLKLEFAILGKLVKFVSGNKLDDLGRRASVGFVPTEKSSSTNYPDSTMNVTDFVDLSRVRTDVTDPSRESGDMRSRRRSRISSQTEYNIARFQHVEDISTLNEGSSRGTSPTEERSGEGEV